jgi:UDP-N-acetylmuramoyl-L-alanyl-D-glutamate--2,6-diaminopimelate ligase
MEVSSHALKLDRVYGVDYDYCLFTNLSRDHLDFHRDMDDYFEAKYLLFERAVASSGKCIINGDDAHGRMIIKRIANDSGDCLVVGRDAESSLRIEDPEVRLDGSKFRLRLRNTEFCDILSPLVEILT